MTDEKEIEDRLVNTGIFENIGTNDPELLGLNNQTPYLLKIIKSSRRFVARFKANNQLEIQFGAGNSNKADEQIIPNPDNIIFHNQNCYLNKFNISCDYLSDGDLKSIKHRFVEPNHCSFWPQVFSAKDNTDFLGFFQKTNVLIL